MAQEATDPGIVGGASAAYTLLLKVDQILCRRRGRSLAVDLLVASSPGYTQMLLPSFPLQFLHFR